MGNCIHYLFSKMRRKEHNEKSIVLLIVGLDNAGKTLILNHISGDPDRNVLPTMGFRAVSLKYKSYDVKIYDLGGSSQIKSLWPKYYNDIHGLIYVVDASDISRLTENKVVFGELISHEHISGKPLLLLANKQDLHGAVDELDLVENLDVERIANATKCPTRVETCSCLYERGQSKSNMMGIINGYKWLLDTILKNYTALNNRVKRSQTVNEKVIETDSISTSSLSHLSVHSNPFKPIKELISKKEDVNSTNNSNNGVNSKKQYKKFFLNRNKTAPLPPEHSSVTVECDTQSTKLETEPCDPQTNHRVDTVILNPVKLGFYQNHNRGIPNRPYTAPERTRSLETETIINIPGQVPQ